MQPRTWIILGALLGAFGVAAGAFGAHVMKSRKLEDAFYGMPSDNTTPQEIVTYKRTMDNFETAVRYQLYHALAMVGAGLLGVTSQRARRTAWLAGFGFLIGIIFFSGSLYGLVFLPEMRWLGMIAPIGGLSLIVGWLVLAIAGFLWTAGDTPAELAEPSEP